MDQPPAITRKNIRAILKYVPCFEADIKNAAERCGSDVGVITIPTVSYSDEVTSLLEDL